MNKEKLCCILLSLDIVKEINNNLDDILKLIPELKDMIGFHHNHPHHHLDVWNHTLLALSRATNELDIRLVLLLHDIGKPHSYQDEEIRHFRGHPKMSAKISFEILKRLNFDYDEIIEMCQLIEQHDSPILENEITNNYEFAIKKFKVQLYDALAHNPLKLEKRIKYLLNINEKLNNYKEKEKCKNLINNFII